MAPMAPLAQSNPPHASSSRRALRRWSAGCASVAAAAAALVAGTPATAYAAGYISVYTAAHIGEHKVGGKAIAAELEYEAVRGREAEGKRYVWEVEVQRRDGVWEAIIDAHSGVVLSVEKENEDEEDDRLGTGAQVPQGARPQAPAGQVAQGGRLQAPAGQVPQGTRLQAPAPQASLPQAPVLRPALPQVPVLRAAVSQVSGT
ncbi:PepSY domain-containing protein [Streptomyces sp. XD-27]|uniref:PepSY domain-containing protein n=1 Tax=Streptomyces sp. XD-27 TaxID=3062779 RepID=UPI0026F43481|nr:PepSY domain-containing protein [Streptomyces sp. XD-27]WKX71880.1 PepSY domain-containing protein [Streptomyces sp. XD-27]